MVLIRRYKGFKIEYDPKSKKFNGKGKLFQYVGEDEDAVIKLIDDGSKRMEEEAKEEKERKLKEATIKKAMGGILKYKLSFDAQALKRFFASCSAFINEGRLIFKGNIMTITAMDPANVAMVHRDQKYSGSRIKLLELGVNFGMFAGVLKKAAQRGVNKIEISFVPPTAGGPMDVAISNGFGEFTLPTIEIEDRELKIPTLKHNVKVVCNLVDFFKAIEMADLTAETCVFEIKDKEFVMTARGDVQRYRSPPGLGRVVLDEGESKAKFSLEYIKKLNGRVGHFFSTKEITIEFHKDYPLIISSKEDGWMLLAPRVDND